MIESRPIVIVRGVGDIGSAVAHRLFDAGFAVVVHDAPLPATTRRGMAFTDAVFDGRALLAGVEAVRVDDRGGLSTVLAGSVAIPVVVTGFEPLLAVTAPAAIVDARMRKRIRAERQRGLAPLVVGLGPGFVAGETVDVAVETSWEALGRVVERGPTLPLAGEPREIAGHARDRYVYAPQAGIMRTGRAIGDLVLMGDIVACLGAVELVAPLSGMLRGLTHDGVPVMTGTKVIEVDPRGPEAVVFGIGERPSRIAAGVLEAITARYRIPPRSG